MNKEDVAQVHDVDGSHELEKANCHIQLVHADTVAHVAASMPKEEQLYNLAELFKVFGDTTRVRILSALSVAELCVCDIAALLEMSQSAISHQLRILKQARLVRYRKDGKSVYYALDDEHVSDVFAKGMMHVLE